MKVQVTCYNCRQSFQKWSDQFKYGTRDFCSQKCYRKTISTGTVIKPCGNCDKKTKRRKAEYEKSKSKNVFCSQSCAAIYNNTHKTHGTRRSKLEVFLEEQIRKDFKKLTLLVNDKTVIGSELDLYLPELKLGIELNGILHYEPIFGQDKLNQIKNNDNRKVIACYEKGVELIVIPTTHKYMNEQRKSEYWQRVKEILSSRLSK